VISLLKIRSADGDGIAIHVRQGSNLCNQGELEHGCAVRQKGAGMINLEEYIDTKSGSDKRPLFVYRVDFHRHVGSHRNTVALGNRRRYIPDCVSTSLLLPPTTTMRSDRLPSKSSPSGAALGMTFSDGVPTS
jgi:hypothetical protein